MSIKRSFSVAAVGIPENEQQILRNIFRLSSYRARSYVLTEYLANAEILVVNSDIGDVTTRHQIIDGQNGRERRAPVIMVVTSQTSTGHKYCIRRPFVATRVLNVLDQVAIKELSFVPELVISDDTSLSSPATNVLQEIPKQELRRGSYRALVVDDSLAVRKLMELELRMLNIRGDFAETAGKAFNLLKTNNYDIIFLDVVLPDIDGYRVCKSIKRDKAMKSTPVLMLTGRSSTFDRVRGKLAGCDSYLTKPAQPETFRKTIKKYLPIDTNVNETEKVDDLPNKEELMRLAELS